LPLSGFKIPSVQPVASRYGGYAIFVALSQSRNHENISNKRLHFFLFVLVGLLLLLRWRYSPRWALACRTIPLHFSLSITNSLSPSSHSQHLKLSFHFFSPSFLGFSSSSRPFQFLSENLFWATYPPPFSPGDPANLSFAPLSILLYFLLYSTLF